ncbi:MAG: Asp-tRNA(Asn)/Glu-tRNA(Gln) amidotransferase subunit GatC [Gemmatimonadota bacterium]
MSIGREEVVHVAKLAELAVSEAELPRLVDQLSRIVDFVAELNEVPADDSVPPFQAGAETTPLRADVVAPIPLARGPAQMAPAFIDGFFVVPRLGAMEES